ncbi:alpha-hydroxy-acid oxidizing protein [Desulfallas thermosapovorans]|uniref:L-lactate oxidase n=1 Tax=Desulfallas thermosapovorans DSM 6562 TaxID=1121431 RepID=A0A5S4ZVF3_9FIRM|nr:alpha-hydroxy-acid oxidizing protein [Desulfallas thermosapovorans]TYO96902.1 isopentenyl diphosphate isomerase/L-lactate dehydrogenase-like FMN-dependent dehydrogenase [Desulfallas thermosapovorans DSM 6562]
MDLDTLRAEAKKNLKGYCRVCPVCDGRACSGEVPGMGGVGTGRGFQANLESLNRYKLNMRTLHNVKDPDTSCKIFGLTLDTPVLAAPMTGTPYNMGGKLSEREFIGSIISGCKIAGGLGFSGDGADPEMYNSGVQAIAAEGGWGIPVIKPRGQKEVIERIRRAEEAHAVAVGMDIDGAGLVTMALKGQPVGPKTPAELREIISSTNLPFIVKGIMTVDEAKIAVDAGAKAIVVSNHGGRILDHTPGAAEVLPAIAAEVKGKVTIFADGGVRFGTDVLKLLALGADAVLLGRPLVVGAFGGGSEGVRMIINKITGELKQAMILTGCASVNDVPGDVIYC